MTIETIEMGLFNKYKDLITVAYKKDIYKDKEGSYRVKAKRTKEREKYLFKGFNADASDNIALIECPKDVLVIEFEKDSTTIKNRKESSKQERDLWVRQTKKNIEFKNLDACIVSHGGTSDYIYLFNLKGLPEGRENEAKKIIAKAIIPDDAQLFTDWSNIGKTLIPVINRQHWKEEKYNGAKHEIIDGKDPREHINDVSSLLIDKLRPEIKREPKQNDLADKIKDKVSLNDTMSKLGFDLTKNPTECIWHDSKSKKCFSYDDAAGLWHCFHCDKGGDVISLVMQDKNTNFIEAAKWFNDEFDLKIEFKEDKKKEDKETQAERIVKEVEDVITLFHDQYSEPYAKIQINSHYEIHAVNSKFFKMYLSKLYFDSSGKIPSSNSINSAILLISSKARFEGEKIKLHNRVAWLQGSIYYDLSDKLWRAVKINGEGWEIVNNPPTIFKRYNHQREQIEPKEKGDYDKVERYYNIKDDKNKQLIKVYIIACLIPGIPHPIPTLHGPQGSAKSTAFKVSRKLIDPSTIEVLGAPKEVKELVQMLSHHYCAYFDNLTKIPIWLSDMLCKAVTGDGFSKRQLFTDDDDIIYSFKRCVGLNGINVVADKPDLLDRAMLLGLEEVDKKTRLPERTFWPNFEKDRPEILGGMFDILSDAMRRKKEIELSELPRMADFAEWGEAISRAMGYDPNSFINNYFDNVEQQNEEAIQAHIIGPAVIQLAKQGDFEGTPSHLLERLGEVAETLKINTKEKAWPKAPHVLTRRLKEIKTNLGNAGIKIQLGRGNERYIVICNNIEKATEATEATLKEEIVIDEGDANDSNDAKFTIQHITHLLDYIRANQTKNKHGAEIEALAAYSKNPRIDDLIKEAKEKGEIVEITPGFLKILE